MKALREKFGEVMAELRGGITLDEAMLLRRLARSVDSGCIVEIGAFRGKSALALVAGALDRSETAPVPIHSIDPHSEFIGYYGGEFGPADRGAYYESMLRFGGFLHAALINLPSYQAAQGWRHPISLLFIDGDHRYHQVREDFLTWDRHVKCGGVVAFDDATDTQCGPFAVVAEAIASGHYVKIEEVGKIVVLRKCTYGLTSAPPAGLRILVPCHILTASGGLLRFERLGRVLNDWGHQLAMTVMADEAATDLAGISVPVYPFDEASRMTWDVTMIPGGGFPEATIERFAAFRAKRFGLRVQHVLNEPQFRPRFLAVNESFLPDIVIFNNPDWVPGTFTDFRADRFHVLCGAVDPALFAPTRRRRASQISSRWIIGGLANKNPLPLVRALSTLPADCELRLFGADVHGLASSYPDLLASGRLKLSGMLYEEDLAGFYRDLDCVVMTETCAGWSNLVAEALSSGVPTICTKHGTAALAQHDISALLIDSSDAESIAAAIGRLRASPELCDSLSQAGRCVAASYSWVAYGRELLHLLCHDGVRHYTHAPALGVHGKWPLQVRLNGLDDLLEKARGASVLDVGSAEGLVAVRFMQAGAEKLHGVELDPHRVATAETVCKHWRGARFWQADLNEWPAGVPAEGGARLDPHYDFVLYLGVHHHLHPHRRKVILENLAARARKCLAIRTSPTLFLEDGIDAVLEENGLILRSSRPAEEGASMLGELRVYVRDGI